jgi:hypothetical protein
VLHRIEDIISLQQLLAKGLGSAKSLDYKPPYCHFFVNMKLPLQEKVKKPAAEKKYVAIYKLYLGLTFYKLVLLNFISDQKTHWVNIPSSSLNFLGNFKMKYIMMHTSFSVLSKLIYHPPSLSKLE